MIPKIYDGFYNFIGVLPDSIKGIAIEERNGMCEIEITYPIFSFNWEELKRGNIITADVNDTLKNQMFRIYKVNKPISGKINVYARHIFFDLARDIIEGLELENASCEYALNELFRNSQFSKDFKGYSDIINAQNYKMTTVNLIKAIGGHEGSILDTYGAGAEILRDNKNVYVLNKRGHDNGVTIEYAKNMTGLNIEYDDSNLITRIKPIAKYNDENNNEIIVESNPRYIDSPKINNYEMPFISEIDFSSEFDNDEKPTAEKLKTLAENYFRDNKCDEIKINIKVEFIPLSKCVGYEDIQDKISLCDIVTIKDYRYKLDTQAKVIKTHYDFLADRYEKMELGEPKVSLGDLVNTGSSNIGETTENKVPGINGSSFPNTLPDIPDLAAKVYGFANVELNWTFENKIYYTYELYASKVKDFTPNVFDLLFQGQASTFLHQVKTNETWYYRVRAVNTHGNATELSEQVTVSTVKINDLSNYVDNAAIGEALIGTLSLDRGWVGQLKGNWIDAKQLSVTDGNGKRTLDIDSFGNVNLDVASFRINSKDVSTTDEIKKLLDDETEPLENRISEAEQKITSNAIINSVSEALNNGESISSTSTVLTKNHFKIKSGSYDSYTLAPNNFTMHNSSTGSETLKIINENCYYDGTNTYTYGPVLKPSSGSAHININDANKTNEGNNFMRFNKAGWIAVNRGITFNRYVVTEGINRDSNRTTTFGSGDSDAGGKGTFSHYTNELNVYAPGASRSWLNYRNWSSETRIGNGNGQGGLGKLTCGSLEVTGTKKNIVSTKNFGYIGLQAYETTDCWYGDIGSGITDDKGVCYIHINPVFKETVNTDIDYKVFISIKDEDLQDDDFVVYKINTSNSNFFRVKTNIPNVKFDYEIKARRKGYENVRLERSTYEEEMPKILAPMISDIEADIKDNEDEVKRSLSIMTLDETSVENNTNMLNINDISIENNINMLKINEFIKKERNVQ